MRFRIIFAVIALAVIGLTISGLLVVLQILSHDQSSAAETPTPTAADLHSASPSPPGDNTPKAGSQTGPVIPGVPGVAGTVPGGLTDVGGIPDLIPADACPICQGLLAQGSGLCSICGGSGKLVGGQQITPSISPQGGLAPQIPLFKVNGAKSSSLLRSAVTSSYDGTAWHLDPEVQSLAYKGETLKPPVILSSGYSLNDISVTTLEDFPTSGMVLPTSLYPVSVDSDRPLTYFPAEQQFFSPQGLPESYSFKSVTYKYSESQLAGAKIDPDRKYQQLPSSTSERIKDLADDITAGYSSPYQRAVAIEKYLKNNYQYDLDYRPAPAGREANDWFLFDEKKGVCTNFNSAFVVLARCAGIPSRLVDGYKIDPGVDEQTVYASQAHAWSEIKLQDLGWLAIDATGESPGALVTLTDITMVDSPILKGRAFVVQGTVTGPDEKPVDGIPVELFINTRKETTGGIPVGSGMAAGGVFSISALVPVETVAGRYQLMAHCLGGIRYQDSWSDPEVIVMAGTAMELYAPSSIKTSEQLMVKGELIEEPSIPVSGQTVDILLGNTLLATLTTDESGQFQMWQSFSVPGEYTLKAVFRRSEYHLASESEINFQVLEPTRLRLTSPLRANLKQMFTVEGFLSEEKSGTALPDQKVFITVDGTLLKDQPVTSSEGVFTLRYSFSEEGYHQFEAVYPGAPFYFESQAETIVEIIPAPVQAESNSNVWLFPVIVLAAVLLVLGLGFFLMRRRRKHSPAAEPLTAEDVPDAADEPEVEPVEEPVAEDKSEIDRLTLSIEFPDIEPPLPDVWGEGEELRVFCYLLKEDGSPLASRQLDLLIGKNANRIATDAGGKAAVQCTFQKKGQYQLAVRYSGENPAEPLVTRRIIRVVDYREEIVELFKSMLEWLRSKGLELPSKATPREIKQIISDAGWVISPEALANLIVCFEEADYSLHTIERKNYKTMYLAQKEIRDNEPAPPADA